MSNQRSFRRCVSYCTANAYNLAGLAQFLKRKGYFVKQLRDVVYVSFAKKSADIFFLSYGCFVCWGLTKAQEQKWVEHIREFAINPITNKGVDHFYYQLGEVTSIDSHERFKIDIITLAEDDAQLKLAISYGLGQAIKLEIFEEEVQETIRRNAYLPTEIATKGIVSLSRRAILKRMGGIFIVRSSINLNSEYMDVPEFFWRNPHLEPPYVMVRKFLDVSSRLMSLNQKLDVLQELLGILSGQMQHRHSSLLELIIIILITVEIMITVLQIHF